ncbi:MAG: PAS domain S-box protein, partial [Chitinophagales bacterium]|nr:PAS domain S-box protein [Chitinophagales bacterium]MBP9220164.1 PAS domain S-box protein [Chitinophagales bacterium]
METNFERNSNVNSLQQFEALFHHATIGIIISNKLGEIINANDMACKFFDYQIDELVGQKIEILLPEKYQHSHQHNRESFYSNPHNRAMGANRDLNARKKDGSTFPVEISLSYYKIKEELFAIAFIIDISERKANEEFMLAQKNELEKKTIEISSMNIGLENKIEDRTKMLRETLQELENSRQELSEAFDKEKELSDLKS